MKFSKLVEHVSKKPIPPHVHHLVVEVMVSDETGEDVEVGAFLSTLCHYLISPYAGSFPCRPNLNSALLHYMYEMNS